MENKYYTPKENEWHVGFEYEERAAEFGIVTKNSEWVKKVFYDLGVLRSNPRVKYLDEEDIESLGFIKRDKNEWAGWNDYHLDTISGQIGYFLYATLHKPRMDNVYKIYLHRYLAEDTKIEDKLKEGESELVFKGLIKNKSELRKLMEMLQINP